MLKHNLFFSKIFFVVEIVASILEFNSFSNTNSNQSYMFDDVVCNADNLDNFKVKCYGTNYIFVQVIGKCYNNTYLSFQKIICFLWNEGPFTFLGHRRPALSQKDPQKVLHTTLVVCKTFMLWPSVSSSWCESLLFGIFLKVGVWIKFLVWVDNNPFTHVGDWTQKSKIAANFWHY